MRFSRKLFKMAGCSAALCFATSALATVNMELTGVNGNSYAGVYTSPYSATVNGVATTVICDDFSTESSIGQTWTANVTTVASVVAGTSSAKFSPAQSYDAVANLATQLLSVSASSQQAVILSFAIWDIFDASGVQSWLTSHGDPSGVYSAALMAANTALTATTYTAGEYSNVYIYSSTVGVPQEFIGIGSGSVSTPETSSPVILAVDLLALGIIVWLFRRRTPGAAK
jgi:hypothetical protein